MFITDQTFGDVPASVVYDIYLPRLYAREIDTRHLSLEHLIFHNTMYIVRE